MGTGQTQIRLILKLRKRIIYYSLFYNLLNLFTECVCFLDTIVFSVDGLPNGDSTLSDVAGFPPEASPYWNFEVWNSSV